MTCLPSGYPHRAIHALLLLLWLGLILGGLIFGPLNESMTQKIPIPICLACTFILAVCAAIWWDYLLGRLRGFAMLLCIGMSFGFLGDLTMARWFVIPPLDPLILGMIWFGLCHIFYIAAWRRIAGILRLTNWKVWLASVTLVILAGIACWHFLVQAPDAGKLRNYGALGYCVLLSGSAGCALALAVQQPRFALSFIGAALLIVSDVLLGSYVFRGNKWFLVDTGVWFIFNLGQLLIVFTPGYLLAGIRRGKLPLTEPREL
jgi:hypothetical protein